jgi:putative Mg2+ transporter-C (MgtC) family protein
MDHLAFYTHAAAAAFMGAAIGFERQWGKHPAGLRTNALVAFGACLFVSLPYLLGDGFLTAHHATTAHLAGQVVVGVGFLGSGIFLRDTLTVHGLNTAATLWCSAAVGTLAGARFLPEALAATVGVLALNLGLQFISEKVDWYLGRPAHPRMIYHLRVVCERGNEAEIRESLVDFFQSKNRMLIQQVAISEANDESFVQVEILSDKPNNPVMEEITRVVRAKSSVKRTSWGFCLKTL